MDYKAFEMEVRKVRMKCKDAIDDPNDSACKTMLSQLQRLEDEAQVGKSSASLNASLKNMRRTAQNLLDSEGMSHRDADMIHDWIEDSLRKVR